MIMSPHLLIIMLDFIIEAIKGEKGKEKEIHYRIKIPYNLVINNKIKIETDSLSLIGIINSPNMSHFSSLINDPVINGQQTIGW